MIERVIQEGGRTFSVGREIHYAFGAAGESELSCIHLNILVFKHLFKTKMISIQKSIFASLFPKCCIWLSTLKCFQTKTESAAFLQTQQ